MTEEVINHPELYKKTEMRLFEKGITELSDYLLPNEYLYFYHYRDRAVSSVLASSKTRGETILEINNHMLEEMRNIDIDKDFEKAFHCFMEHYAMRENSYFSIESGKIREEKFAVPTAEEYVKLPDNGGYAAVALEFIKAKNTGVPVQMVLSIPNEGALDFLKAEDVCEITCKTDCSATTSGESMGLSLFSLVQRIPLFRKARTKYGATPLVVRKRITISPASMGRKPFSPRIKCVYGSSKTRSRVSR